MNNELNEYDFSWMMLCDISRIIYSNIFTFINFNKIIFIFIYENFLC